MGSHFDDVEVGMGGTLLKHIGDNDEVYIAILNSDEFRTGDVDKRKKEQLGSLKIMDLSEQNLLLFTSNEKDADIISKLDELKPDIIYTHYIKDTHQDHIRCSVIGQAVGRKKHIVTMFYDSGSSYEFNPILFTIIDFEKKAELIKCFTTQLQRGSISVESRKILDSHFACLVSNDESAYAEGFITRRIIMS
jgi:LmbE family N-acetylglucosaminyl deacetylase